MRETKVEKTSQGCFASSKEAIGRHIEGFGKYDQSERDRESSGTYCGGIIRRAEETTLPLPGIRLGRGEGAPDTSLRLP